MPWMARNMATHACPYPDVSSHGEGDIWQCDICGRYWRFDGLYSDRIGSDDRVPRWSESSFEEVLALDERADARPPIETGRWSDRPVRRGFSVEENADPDLIDTLAPPFSIRGLLKNRRRDARGV